MYTFMKVIYIIVILVALVMMTHKEKSYVFYLFGLALIGAVLFETSSASSSSPLVEHLQISNEAVQNVGSIYNEDKMIIKDLDVTGLLNAGTINLLPAGVIVAWRGDAPPTGWALCDGANGTPDLRGRFILGSGQGTNLTNRAINTVGGEEKHQLLVNELPRHKHQYTYRGVGVTDKGTSAGKNEASNKDIATSYTGMSGSDLPHENMPPFYVLTYIIKI
jgi:microcystin-dependent protein